VLLPYWEKRVEAGLWLKLWKGAAEQLRRTDILIIWGYSLPTTDLKARELLTLAFERREAKLAKVVVIDPSKETQERWRRMFVRKIFFRFPNFDEFNRGWAGAGWRSLA
jgi:anaerobic selenocysteine-containing dehydrogenase